MVDLLTIKEVAKILKKSESTIRTWIRREILPSQLVHRIGRSVYLNAQRFNDWMLENGN